MTNLQMFPENNEESLPERKFSWMRYAVISDIHSNLEALEAVLRDLEEQEVDEVVCLGDVVGYYANPNECVSICRERRFKCIRGNHDDAVLGLCPLEDFNPVAQAALVWTAHHLAEEHRAWLRQLPAWLLVAEDFLAVHGSPWHPYAYIFSSSGASRAFAHLKECFPQVNTCFFGHTHQKALFWTEDGSVQRAEKENKFILGSSGLYLINPGSIGQPRDGKPGASYTIYDSRKRELEFRCVTYELAVTQRKVREAGLPAMLAERLSYGY